jgi:hypothetical protein
MSPALLTRETLALIRREAWRGPRVIAAQLEWTEERTARVARTHGISFDVGKPLVEEEPPPPPKPKARDEYRAAPTPSVTQTCTRGWTEFPVSERSAVLIDNLSHTIVHRRRLVLRPAMFRIFATVFGASAPISTDGLAERAGVTKSALKSHICQMNLFLVSVDLAVKSPRGGFSDGYRLMRRAAQ